MLDSGGTAFTQALVTPASTITSAGLLGNSFVEGPYTLVGPSGVTAEIQNADIFIDHIDITVNLVSTQTGPNIWPTAAGRVCVFLDNRPYQGAPTWYTPTPSTSENLLASPSMMGRPFQSGDGRRGPRFEMLWDSGYIATTSIQQRYSVGGKVNVKRVWELAPAAAGVVATRPGSFEIYVVLFGPSVGAGPILVEPDAGIPGHARICYRPEG